MNTKIRDTRPVHAHVRVRAPAHFPFHSFPALSVRAATMEDGVMEMMLQAANGGDLQCLRGVVENCGVHVNSRDDRHRTALHMAASRGQLQGNIILWQTHTQTPAHFMHEANPCSAFSHSCSIFVKPWSRPWCSRHDGKHSSTFGSNEVHVREDS